MDRLLKFISVQYDFKEYNYKENRVVYRFKLLKENNCIFQFTVFLINININYFLIIDNICSNFIFTNIYVCSNVIPLTVLNFYY